MLAPESRLAVIVAPSAGVALSKPRQMAPEPRPPTSVQGPPVEVENWSLNASPAASDAPVSPTLRRIR